ncbi:unnamed protein product [Urochloa humidicola]
MARHEAGTRAWPKSRAREKASHAIPFFYCHTSPSTPFSPSSLLVCGEEGQEVVHLAPDRAVIFPLARCQRRRWGGLVLRMVDLCLKVCRADAAGVTGRPWRGRGQVGVVPEPALPRRPRRGGSTTHSGFLAEHDA